MPFSSRSPGGGRRAWRQEKQGTNQGFEKAAVRHGIWSLAEVRKPELDESATIYRTDKMSKA
jgi:hypothetical protein